MYEAPFHKADLNKYSFLVTGGAGFIGANLVEYLIKYGAAKVRVLDNLSTGFLHNIEPYLNHPSFEFIQGDIRDIDTCQKACQGIDIVFHEAALGSVPRSIQDPITTNAVNISGFLNMLVAVRDQKVKRIVYAASSSTYGDSKKLPKVEHEIGKPLSPYAVTKYVNELYADVFAKTYNMQIVGLRYFNVFGPRQSPEGAYAAVIPLFIQSFSKNTSPYIDGDGEQTRDFTFVENAVQANIKAAFTTNEKALNEVFNTAVGDRTSLNKVATLIKEIAGASVSPTNRAARAGDIRDSHADISKAKDLLEYNPLVRIEEGLKITYNWFCKEKIHTK